MGGTLLSTSLAPSPSVPRSRGPTNKVNQVNKVSAKTASIAQPKRKLDGLKVAVDVDEVLGMFLRSMCRYCKEERGMHHKVEDFTVYEFAKIWRCDHDASNHIVHDFFESKHFRDGIPVIPGAFDVLQRLKEHHELEVVTSRQFAIQAQTQEWLSTHYPDIFSAVHFGNHFAKVGETRKKSEICRDIGAHVLIDDNPTYAADCAQAGMHVLLFNWNLAYPWCQQLSGEGSANVTVVRDWQEVEACLATLPAHIAHSS